MRLAVIRPEAQGSPGEIYALLERRHPAAPDTAGPAASECRPPGADPVPAGAYAQAANDD